MTKHIGLWSPLAEISGLTFVVASSLFTDPNLNVITKEGHVDPDVWAIGDAANIKGQLLPATAQGTYPLPYLAPMGCGLIVLSTVANQKAIYVAQKLNKIVKDQEHTKPFEFHNKGSLAYLGDWCVVLSRWQSTSDSALQESNL